MSENNPDSASSPLETILEILDEKQMSMKELAEKCGFFFDDVFKLIIQSGAYDVHIAIRLERALGVPYEFWMERKKNYVNLLKELKDAGKN